jgi:nitrite reductase/ring-hydroxylating ferredoxin subunit
MADQKNSPAGPDLSQGVAFSEFSGDMLLGHVGDDEVLLVRSGSEIFAIDAHCSHYHGPLADGLVDGESIHCPWHHACFDLRTGEAARAPAFNQLAVWKVERDGDRIVVRQKREQPKPRIGGAVDAPSRIVIVGGGAAGFAAAEMLRRQEYRGSIVMLSSERAPPVDRPNLSKDYLAGSAPEDWLPLRPNDFYAGADIDLRLGRCQNKKRAARRRPERSIRPPAAGDGCGARAPADPGRRPGPCSRVAHA